jgi:putative oxidoreductase
MDVILLIGRILFASIFIVLGSTVHLLNWRDGVAYARAKNVPAPELLVPASGLMAVSGGLLLVIGLWADLGALLLAAFVFPVAVGMHAFWKVEDPMERLQEQVHFMKDVALGVGPEQVGSADRGLVAEGRVTSSMVVVPEPAVKSGGAVLA